MIYDVLVLYRQDSFGIQSLKSHTGRRTAVAATPRKQYTRNNYELVAG